MFNHKNKTKKKWNKLVALIDQTRKAHDLFLTNKIKLHQFFVFLKREENCNLWFRIQCWEKLFLFAWFLLHVKRTFFFLFLSFFLSFFFNRWRQRKSIILDFFSSNEKIQNHFPFFLSLQIFRVQMHNVFWS